MNKKGISSIITFSILFLISIILLSFVYSYSSDSKQNSIILIKNLEILNELESFKLELLSLVTNVNSSIIFISNIPIQVNLTNNILNGTIINNGNIYNSNLELSSLNFCNNYIFNLGENNIFKYNGSCISLE